MVGEEKLSFNENFNDALSLFNEQKWYEAHDAFEDIWNILDGDERQVVHGILQVSVSQFHLSKGNINGATILLGEGLGRIKNRTYVNFGVDLDSFCLILENLLKKLQFKEKFTKNDMPFLIRN